MYIKIYTGAWYLLVYPQHLHFFTWLEYIPCSFTMPQSVRHSNTAHRMKEAVRHSTTHIIRYSMIHSMADSVSVQVSGIASRALDLLTQAGVTLVPFDSQALNDVSADAWGTGTESYAFEDTDTLARCMHPLGRACFCHVFIWFDVPHLATAAGFGSCTHAHNAFV